MAVIRLLLLAAFAGVAPVSAQVPSGTVMTGTAATSATAPAPAGGPGTVDVARLPVNLSRIQRRLQASAEQQARDGLNLRFFVDVYAPAPAIVLFTKEDNLTGGQAPYGAPTHDQMIASVTPRGMAPPPRGRVTKRSKR